MDDLDEVESDDDDCEAGITEEVLERAPLVLVPLGEMRPTQLAVGMQQVSACWDCMHHNGWPCALASYSDAVSHR